MSKLCLRGQERRQMMMMTQTEACLLKAVRLVDRFVTEDHRRGQQDGQQRFISTDHHLLQALQMVQLAQEQHRRPNPRLLSTVCADRQFPKADRPVSTAGRSNVGHDNSNDPILQTFS